MGGRQKNGGWTISGPFAFGKWTNGQANGRSLDTRRKAGLIRCLPTANLRTTLARITFAFITKSYEFWTLRFVLAGILIASVCSFAVRSMIKRSLEAKYIYQK